MLPYRETVTRRAVGERKYVQYFNGRGHFAHLRVELSPRPGGLPSVTVEEGLQLPPDCHHAARAALFQKLHRGPVHGFPLIGLEVRLLGATHLPPYSDPESFAAVARMALDEAMIHAAPEIVEPWIGLRLRVEGHALAATLAKLTEFLGCARARISLGDHFVLDLEIPASIEERLASALGLKHPQTYPLEESQRYRPLAGPLDRQTAQDALGDWT
jgi:elongation factor G